MPCTQDFLPLLFIFIFFYYFSIASRLYQVSPPSRRISPALSIMHEHGHRGLEPRPAGLKTPPGFSPCSPCCHADLWHHLLPPPTAQRFFIASHTSPGTCTGSTEERSSRDPVALPGLGGDPGDSQGWTEEKKQRNDLRTAQKPRSAHASPADPNTKGAWP